MIKRIDNKKNRKIPQIVIVIFLIGILLSACIFIYPSVYEYQCKTRHFNDFENKVTNEILESNILIVKYEEKVIQAFLIVQAQVELFLIQKMIHIMH